MSKSDDGDLRKKDILNLVIADVVDLTDGPFDVTFASDDGGTHIQIAIEHHEDAQKIVERFKTSMHGYRALVLKVPAGYLDL